AAAAKAAGEPVGFAEWMLIGIPIAAVLLVLCWLLLTRVLFKVSGTLPGVRELVQKERGELGAWTAGQRITVIVLLLAALGWVLREPKDLGALHVPGLAELLLGLSDT